ncbi:coiled-coil domain-containing protein 172 isoform X2 [Lingula anatina]|uniref:Coiled-coil domain-containing protein 172 n=1 Tax=Lingula anatina TaxID=7574 RepID=A0A1S3HDK8_LINAN|nr:coiled-coil domain-containing protein 172 isoform X2 [Lingula anatina]|eukprot:XP_013383179.1 coiled-coil domain-containing protein 172 isoform X2 [Lingula anatina]
MAAALDDLFGQILISEQKAQERKSQLNEVKTNIAHSRKKIEESEDEIHSLQLQLSAKRKLQENIAHLQSEFCSKVWEFGQEYDLVGDGRQKREKIAREEFQELKKKEHKITKELACFRAHQENVDKLEMDKKTSKVELQKLEQQLKLIVEDELVQMKKLKELEKDRNLIYQLPQTDSEFKWLHAELESAREDKLECLCNALQQELQELQQQQWQRQLQMQKLKQQQNRQRLALKPQDKFVEQASNCAAKNHSTELKSGPAFAVLSSSMPSSNPITDGITEGTGPNGSQHFNRQVCYRRGVKRSQRVSQSGTSQPVPAGEYEQNIFISRTVAKDAEGFTEQTKKIRFK